MLDGLAPDALCPECGFFTPRIGAVPARVRCIGCGYSLAGLSPGGVCPECGVGVRWSMPTPLLVFGDAAYVRRLRCGTRWVCNTLLGWVVLLIAMAAGAILLPMYTGPAIADGVNLMLGWLSHGLFFGHLWGWWLLATPDPALGGGGSARGRSLRVIVPIAAAMYVLTLGGFFVAGLASQLGLLMLLGGLVLLVLSMLIVVYGMLVVRDLALRVPSVAIYRKAKFRAWFVPVLTFAGAAGVLVCFLLPALLAALIMYYNIVAKLQHELSAVLRRMEEAQGESGDGSGGESGEDSGGEPGSADDAAASA